jgi:iron complex outermembrane receptor protein
MTTRTAVVSVSLVLAGAAIASAGPDPSASTAAPAVQEAAGQVMDSTGGVIVGATVTLRGSSGFGRDTTTDARGRYRFQDVPPGVYLLTAFRDGFAPATQELTVSASGPATADVTLSPASFADEVTVSFTGAHSMSALKIDTPVRDIPLSVQSYTSSFMKAIESTNVADLYNYTTGVSRSGNTGVDFVIRGIRASNTGNIQYNGLPGLAARFNSPSTENVERIEVLKGPSSVLYGQAQPGGIINIVTKKPQAERAQIVDLRGGTFFGTGAGFGDSNKYHLAADFTGPIDKSRKLLYRLVAAYDNEQTFRDFAENEDLYVVPSLSWLGWHGTILNLEFEYRRTRTALDSGLVAPQNDITLVAPINVRYQEPADYINEDGKTASLSLKKLFGGGLTWNVNWRSVWHEDDTKGFENLGLTGLTTVTRRDRRQLNTRRFHYLDTTLARSVSTASIQHKLLFGVNGGYELTDFDRVQFASAASLNVNILNPVHGARGLASRPDTHRYTPAWSYGVYLNDQIDLSPRWKALAGLRYDRRESQEEELRINPRVREKTSDALLPVVGLVFQPSRTWSLYGSFATSFTPPPPGAADARGENPFGPERGRQLEAGVKADLGGGRGEASLSLFEITKDDVLITLVAQAVNDQIGQERSRGLEATLSHRILDNWQVIAGYTFADSKVTEDSDPVRVGSRITNAPRHSANFWSRYDIRRGPLSGLGFGLGLVYSGERAGTIRGSSSTLPVLTLPGYFRVDGGIYYVAGRYELTARMVNLLDERYYESNLGTATTSLNIRPGSPRAATLSVRVKF